MSRSNPRVESSNPCKKFLKWKGAEGHFVMWNKTTEKEEIVNPRRMLFLDKLFTVKGFSDKHQQGIYSNEIHSTKTEQLNVRVFGNDSVSIVGLYDEIKDKMPAGAKLGNSLYVMCEGEIINLQLTGSALSAWIEFCKANKSWQSGAIVFEGKSELKKKGATKYYEPIFSLADATPEEDAKAIELDKELQDYFKGYKEGKTTPTPEAELVEDDIDLSGLNL
jgi:hypothetical protein